jgi:hypothetical protein
LIGLEYHAARVRRFGKTAEGQGVHFTREFSGREAALTSA